MGHLTLLLTGIKQGVSKVLLTLYAMYVHGVPLLNPVLFNF
jgi:hypothetical protein